LELLLCLLELHLGLFQLLLLLVGWHVRGRTFGAWGLYLDRFPVRGLSPGIAVAVVWSVEHLAI
jgi:hypothetical protein